MEHHSQHQQSLEGYDGMKHDHHQHQANSEDHVFDERGNLNLASINSDTHMFCNKSRMGMIMYMDGFRWSLQGGNHPCLNLLFPGWTLDTPLKFGGGIVLVFFLAMFVEGFSKLRHKIVRSAKRAHCNRGRSRSSNTGLLQSESILRAAVTTLHGLQALLGYILMLVTMTFSMELFVAVVAGLAAGYGLFFQTADFLAKENVNEDLHVTSNPCCDFMEEESREQYTFRRFPLSSQSSTTTEEGTSSSLTEGLLPFASNN